MRGSKAFPLGLLLLAVLLAPAGAFARATVSPDSCAGIYAKISKVHFGAPAGELPEKYRAVLAAYSADNLGRRRQITELLDLRLELEQRGKIADPARRLKYEALEWKNLHLGLIDGDLDGKAFLEAVKKFTTVDKNQKLAGIAAFANSRHPAFGRVLADLIDRENDLDVLRALREVAAMRRIPIRYRNNPNLLPAIVSEATFSSGSGFRSLELAQLPDEIVYEWLNSGDTHKTLAAMAGFSGRSNEFLLRYFNWPNSSVQVRAIENLSVGENAELEIELLRSMALFSKDKWVRQAAVEKLTQYTDDRAIAVLKEWKAIETEPAQLNAAAQALNRAEYNAQETAKARRIGSSYSPENIFKTVMGTDLTPALEATRGMLDMSIEAKLKALKAPLAEVRAEVAKRAIQFSPSAKVPVGKILMQDKVADLRLLGLDILSHRGVGSDPEVYRLIKLAAEADEDPDVRRKALSLISVRDQKGRVFNQSQESTYTHYLNKAKEELGAPEVRERDVIPYAAASHIYDAPEALLGKSPEELALMHKRFQETAPVGYKVAKLETDPESGFVGAIYTSSDSIDRPLIVSIAGTWTPEDVLADANLGVKQARSQAFRDLVEAAQGALRSNPKAPEMVIAGHSLGGGMSQVFGHELIASLKKSFSPSLAEKVRVASFNGFGGEEALKRIGSYDPEIVKSMRAVNYYVPWDVVSVFGNHIGESIKLPNLGTRNPAAVHKMGALGKAFLEKGGLVGDLGEARGRRYVVPAITRVIGPVLDKLIYLKYKVREKKIFLDLCQARLDWAANEEFKRLKPEYDWLKPELERAAENMFGEKKRDEARKMLQWVESQRLKIIRERQAPDAAIPPA